MTAFDVLCRLRLSARGMSLNSIGVPLLCSKLLFEAGVIEMLCLFADATFELREWHTVDW